MNYCLFGLLILTLSSCRTTLKTSEISENPDPQIQENPVQIKKTIHDMDYRNSNKDQSIKKRILILPFTDEEKTFKSTIEAKNNARQSFSIELLSGKSIQITELKDIPIDSENYLKSGEYDLKKIAKDIQKSGVHLILAGQIIDVRLKKTADQVGVIRSLKAIYEVVVRLRILNVHSRQEIFHTVKTVTLEENNTRVAERVRGDQLFIQNPTLVEVLIKDAFLDFTNQLETVFSTVSWEGRVAAIRDEKIYINVGRISGVQIGDILKVVEDGSEIYDSELGYNLGQIPGRLKGTLEVVSYFGSDAAIAILHSGSGFKESDRVELYQGKYE